MKISFYYDYTTPFKLKQNLILLTSYTNCVFNSTVASFPDSTPQLLSHSDKKLGSGVWERGYSTVLQWTMCIWVGQQEKGSGRNLRR